MSIPRSARTSSTLRSDSGYLTYISTTRRMTSGELLKYRNGLVIAQCQHGHSAPSFSSDTAHRTPKASVFAAQGLFRWLPRLVVMTNKVRIWRNAGEAARLGDFHV